MTSLVHLTPLKQIATPGGDVMHAIKASDFGYRGFGEAYFSLVEKGFVKGWKRHNRMTMNLVVPVGRVQFSIHNDTTGETQNVILGPNEGSDYARLTVEPGLWMAFGGVDEGPNLILNVADILHDATEADKMAIEAFVWTWST